MIQIKEIKDTDGNPIYMVETRVSSIKEIKEIKEIMDWCIETFGERSGCCWVLTPDKEWSIYVTSYGNIQVKFRNEANANWFLLRWA